MSSGSSVRSSGSGASDSSFVAFALSSSTNVGDASLGTSEEQVNKLIKKFDRDGDGDLDLSELKELASNYQAIIKSRNVLLITNVITIVVLVATIVVSLVIATKAGNGALLALDPPDVVDPDYFNNITDDYPDDYPNGTGFNSTGDFNSTALRSVVSPRATISEVVRDCIVHFYAASYFRDLRRCRTVARDYPERFTKIPDPFDFRYRYTWASWLGPNHDDRRKSIAGRSLYDYGAKKAIVIERNPDGSSFHDYLIDWDASVAEYHTCSGDKSVGIFVRGQLMLSSSYQSKSSSWNRWECTSSVSEDLDVVAVIISTEDGVPLFWVWPTFEVVGVDYPNKLRVLNNFVVKLPWEKIRDWARRNPTYYSPKWNKPET